MTERRARFVALAREQQRADAANELERRRQATDAPDETQEQEDEGEKLAERAALERRMRARERVERLKRVWRDHPEVKAACYLISMACALMLIQYLLENGKRAW